MPLEVQMRAVLGEARVDASDLARLVPGDVIVLDNLVADPLRVMVGNCERFAGFPGTKGRKMALQVSGTVDDDGWVKSFGEANHE
jgi:flagellar motor switch protein FliM